MPGRYLSEQEMYQLVSQNAQAAIQKYGIEDADAFIEALLCVAHAESGKAGGMEGYTGRVWDSQATHDQGQGAGLFALHNQGYAGNLSWEDRMDAATNIAAAADKLGALWRDADTFDTNLQRMTGPQGQNPASPQALYTNARAAAAHGRIYGPALPGETLPPEGAGQTRAGTMATLGEWIVQQGYTQGYTDPDTGTNYDDWAGMEWYNAQPSDIRTRIYDDWASATGRATSEAASSTPLESRGLTPEERRVQGLDVAERETAMGLWPYDIEVAEYERKYNEYLDKVRQGEWNAEQAVSEFNAWLSASQEAARRAEKVMDIRETRARRTLSTPYFPQTEPGGMLAQEAAARGMAFTPWKGQPVSQMPSHEDLYAEFQQQMGLSGQAPALSGGYIPPAAPQAPAAGQAIELIKNLLNKANIRQSYSGVT